jgi:hypothetical protein
MPEFIQFLVKWIFIEEGRTGNVEVSTSTWKREKAETAVIGR